MVFHMKKIILALLFCLLLPVAASAEMKPKSMYVMPFDRAVIRTQTEDVHKFKVEKAMTPKALQRGLKHRTEMAEDTGMLFLFREEQMATMWMKDTLIPLDMIFIDGKGKIVMIHENAEPLSEEHIYSTTYVRAILELNGGVASKLGIKVGDWLDYPILR